MLSISKKNIQNCFLNFPLNENKPVARNLIIHMNQGTERIFTNSQRWCLAALLSYQTFVVVGPIESFFLFFLTPVKGNKLTKKHIKMKIMVKRTQTNKKKQKTKIVTLNSHVS